MASTRKKGVFSAIKGGVVKSKRRTQQRAYQRFVGGSKRVVDHSFEHELDTFNGVKETLALLRDRLNKYLELQRDTLDVQHEVAANFLKLLSSSDGQTPAVLFVNFCLHLKEKFNAMQEKVVGNVLKKINHEIDTFPDVSDLVDKRARKLTDVESYQRKYQEAKEKNSDRIKPRERKLMLAEEAYESVLDEIHIKFDEIEIAKNSILCPAFEQLVGDQSDFYASASARAKRIFTDDADADVNAAARVASTAFSPRTLALDEAMANSALPHGALGAAIPRHLKHHQAAERVPGSGGGGGRFGAVNSKTAGATRPVMRQRAGSRDRAPSRMRRQRRASDPTLATIRRPRNKKEGATVFGRSPQGNLTSYCIPPKRIRLPAALHFPDDEKIMSIRRKGLFVAEQEVDVPHRMLPNTSFPLLHSVFEPVEPNVIRTSQLMQKVYDPKFHAFQYEEKHSKRSRRKHRRILRKNKDGTPETRAHARSRSQMASPHHHPVFPTTVLSTSSGAGTPVADHSPVPVGRLAAAAASNVRMESPDPHDRYKRRRGGAQPVGYARTTGSGQSSRRSSLNVSEERPTSSKHQPPQYSQSHQSLPHHQPPLAHQPHSAHDRSPLTAGGLQAASMNDGLGSPGLGPFGGTGASPGGFQSEGMLMRFPAPGGRGSLGGGGGAGGHDSGGGGSRRESDVGGVGGSPQLPTSPLRRSVSHTGIGLRLSNAGGNGRNSANHSPRNGVFKRPPVTPADFVLNPTHRLHNDSPDSSRENSPRTSITGPRPRRSSLYTKNSPRLKSRRLPQPSKTMLQPGSSSSSLHQQQHQQPQQQHHYNATAAAAASSRFTRMSNLSRELHRSGVVGLPPAPPTTSSTTTPTHAHRHHPYAAAAAAAAAVKSSQRTSRSLPPTPVGSHKAPPAFNSPHVAPHSRARHQQATHFSPPPPRPQLASTASTSIPAVAHISSSDSSDSGQQQQSKSRRRNPPPAAFAPHLSHSHSTHTPTGTQSAHSSPQHKHQSHAHSSHTHARFPPHYATQTSAPASSYSSSTSTHLSSSASSDRSPAAASAKFPPPPLTASPHRGGGGADSSRATHPSGEPLPTSTGSGLDKNNSSSTSRSPHPAIPSSPLIDRHLAQQQQQQQQASSSKATSVAASKAGLSRVTASSTVHSQVHKPAKSPSHHHHTANQLLPTPRASRVTDLHTSGASGNAPASSESTSPMSPSNSRESPRISQMPHVQLVPHKKALPALPTKPSVVASSPIKSKSPVLKFTKKDTGMPSLQLSSKISLQRARDKTEHENVQGSVKPLTTSHALPRKSVGSWHDRDSNNAPATNTTQLSEAERLVSTSAEKSVSPRHGGASATPNSTTEPVIASVSLPPPPSTDRASFENATTPTSDPPAERTTTTTLTLTPTRTKKKSSSISERAKMFEKPTRLRPYTSRSQRPSPTVTKRGSAAAPSTGGGGGGGGGTSATSSGEGRRAQSKTLPRTRSPPAAQKANANDEYRRRVAELTRQASIRRQSEDDMSFSPPLSGRKSSHPSSPMRALPKSPLSSKTDPNPTYINASISTGESPPVSSLLSVFSPTQWTNHRSSSSSGSSSFSFPPPASKTPPPNPRSSRASSSSSSATDTSGGVPVIALGAKRRSLPHTPTHRSGKPNLDKPSIMSGNRTPKSNITVSHRSPPPSKSIPPLVSSTNSSSRSSSSASASSHGSSAAAAVGPRPHPRSASRGPPPVATAGGGGGSYNRSKRPSLKRTLSFKKRSSQAAEAQYSALTQMTSGGGGSSNSAPAVGSSSGTGSHPTSKQHEVASPTKPGGGVSHPHHSPSTSAAHHQPSPRRVVQFSDRSTSLNSATAAAAHPSSSSSSAAPGAAGNSSSSHSSSCPPTPSTHVAASSFTPSSASSTPRGVRSLPPSRNLPAFPVAK